MTGTHDIVAIGEPLMELAQVEIGGRVLYEPGHGGDTSNCVIAAARQGARCAYVSAVGDDAFGRGFLDLWDREGVDRSGVIVRPRERTGLYLISYDGAGHHFTYYRTGSAASLLTAAEIPEALIAGASVLHVSGISQAISTTACDAVFHAIALAKRHGVRVSYDSNLRPALWPLDRARAIIHAGMAHADIARPGLDDAKQLTGLDEPDAIGDFYLRLGAKLVALTMGAAGTLVATPERRETVATFKVEAVDATGAGDTFGGAFLAEYVRTGDPWRSARYANAAAALSTRGRGAVAPMPHRHEVEAALETSG